MGVAKQMVCLAFTPATFQRDEPEFLFSAPWPPCLLPEKVSGFPDVTVKFPVDERFVGLFHSHLPHGDAPPLLETELLVTWRWR